MGITFSPTNQTFSLQTPGSTYAFCIHPRLRIPVHLHWGAAIGSPEDLVSLIDERSRPLSPDPFPDERVGSLDTLAQELPVAGTGDFRVPALIVRQTDGSRVIDLAYRAHRITPGKPPLPGLPATYVEDPGEADTLEIELEDAKVGLSVVMCYTAFRDHDAIARSLRVTNRGDAALDILSALSCSLDLPRADSRLLQLSGNWTRERFVEVHPLRPGLQAIDSRRGSSSHVHNPFLALLSPGATEDAGEVRGFSLVYSGNFVAQAEVNPLRTTRVSLGINPQDFSWRLEPGESFQTPEAVLVFSATGLGSMSRGYHRLYRQRLCRGKFRDRARPVVINNWEATYFDFDEDKLVRLASKAAGLGIETFVLDDGWFGRRDDDRSSLGDWTVNRRKLPSGLDGLGRKINELGLEFGLWFEPEMISPDSELYRAHPDWCLHVPGRKRTTGRHQLVLDLSRREICDYIISSLSAILASAPIRYVKWDMNRHLTEAGSTALPPERQMEVSHRHLLGVYRMMEELTAHFPDVLFEGCASGGGRFDPGMLYYMPQFWTSDNTDAITRLKIQHGTSVVYPWSTISAHVSAVPNHQMHRSTDLAARGHAAMTGAFGYELDLNVLTADEQEEVRGQIHLYKEVRSLLYGGDHYRLLSPFEGNEAAWMSVSPDQSEAVVVYFRILAEAVAPAITLRLRGLSPSARYRVNDSILGGDLLMNHGLPVPGLNGDFRSVMWRLRAV